MSTASPTPTSACKVSPTPTTRSIAGREKLIAETVARLTAPDEPLALLFITGASGSGKSSFVQAGVLPALEKHYAALSLKWAVFRPSRDPLAALADAAVAATRPAAV